MKKSDFLISGSEEADYSLALAHGAGAGMDTPFMDFFATSLATAGCRVIRFEFPYMASKRATGKFRPPDRELVLRESWLHVIETFGPENLVIGGKSMGGRIVSLVAGDVGVAGLVCLGYPFHPVEKLAKLRVEHLKTIKTPTLIVQGERDPFGGRDEVPNVELSRNVKIVWLKHGDHSFKPRKASGASEQQNLESASVAIVAFLKRLKSA